MNRQDSLYDQMIDVMTWARENGCYDAYDWIANAFAHDDRSATNRSLDAAPHAQPSLSVTATNDASTASPIATDTPSALREKTK